MEHFLGCSECFIGITGEAIAAQILQIGRFLLLSFVVKFMMILGQWQEKGKE